MIRTLAELRNALENGEPVDLFEVSSSVPLERILKNIAGEDEGEARLSAQVFFNLKQKCMQDRSMADVLADRDPTKVDESELEDGEGDLLDNLRSEVG